MLLLPSLTGCWVLPIKSDTPDEYYERKNTIESFYGSTQEDIIRELGEPERIEKIGSTTYFIYQSEAYEYGVGVIILLPVWFGHDTYVFCLFLEFDEANHLVKHTSKGPLYQSYGDLDDACIDSFSPSKQNRKNEWKLSKVVGTYCPNADLGHADAQKHIGDLYYQGLHGLHKDLTQAYIWYTLAANGGDNGAAVQLDKLTNEFSPQKLNEAQIQLEAWEPGQCEIDLWEAISRRNE